MHVKNLEEHRKSLDRYHASNVAFILKNNKGVKPSNYSNAIKQTKSKFLKAIEKYDKELFKRLENDSLEYLKKVIDSNNIELASGRKRDWEKAEKDIADGFNKLLEDNVFVYVDKDGNEHEVNSSNFIAKTSGKNVKDSDVCIMNIKKKLNVFVECKKDYETSEFLKFNLEVQNGKLKYNHKFHLRNLNDEDKKKIDELFSHEIDLSGFLNNAMQDPKLKKFWETFLENIERIQKSIAEDEDFKEFAEKVSFASSFPQNAENIIKIFDVYVKHYIDRYDNLLEQILMAFEGSYQIDLDDHKLSGYKNLSLGEVAKRVNYFMDLMHMWQEVGEDQFNSRYSLDEGKMLALSDELKTIEAKISKVMETVGTSIPHDLLKLSRLDKLRYFFAAFLSSVGRKSKGNDVYPLVTSHEDKLGNMQICPPTRISSRRFAQIVCKYYISKDHCIYLQAGDTIYKLSKDYNLFSIPGLPNFEDEITQFVIAILVKDDLKNITLHVKAVAPDLSAFKTLSFKQDDPNFVEKKHKKIEIHAK